MNRKRTALAAVLAATALALTGCTDAGVVSENLSKDADNFKVPRRITFVNGITDKYLLTIEGFCAIKEDRSDGQAQLEVTCKTGGGYKKHFLGLSDNVTYVAEQVSPAAVSANHYKVIFKPSVIIPDPEAR